MGATIHVLGQGSFNKGQQREILASQRPLLLCTYLIAQEAWVSRDALLVLFWPEDTESKARNKLRQLLFRTQKEPYAEFLEVEESRLRLNIESDLNLFKETFEEGNWLASLEHYKNDLLVGEQAKNLPNYQDWLELTRQELRDMWQEASLNHAKNLIEQHDYTKANRYLKAVLEKDLLAEDILQSYLSNCIKSGQRKDGLDLYERFESLLLEELQIEPLTQTTDLVEALKNIKAKDSVAKQDVLEDDSSIAAESTTSLPKEKQQQALNIPSYSSGFIGRDLELIELVNSLKQGTRLITIVGQGGIGKTRLLTEVAKQEHSNFKHGTVYFSLAPLESSDYFINYCLEALNIPTYAQLKPLEQLLGYLANHEHLLVFDNFEHLIVVAPLLIQFLDASPKTSIVVSSREILNLSNETIFELAGLSYPSPEDSLEGIAATEVYESVQLFLRTARNINTSFSLNNDNETAIRNICQKLEGSPLTIELAAAWSRMLSPEEIEAELEQNLDVLEVNWADVPERHKSARAVFEYSWNLLTPSEQDLLKKLSVFNGGFTKDAAQTVASANLRTLLSLVNKSLLTRNSDGRFLRHVLVQQYSKEKLALDKDLEQAAKEQHALYFQGLLEEIPHMLSHSEQLKYVEGLELEHTNLRTALDWYISQTTENSCEASLTFCDAMSFFWEWQSYFDEASSYLKQTHTKTKPHSEHYQNDYAKLLTHSAFFAHIQADFSEAESLAQEALEMFEKLEDSAGQCDATNVLSKINHSYSKFEEAKNYTHKSLDLAKELQDPYREARALSRLGGIYERLDKHTSAYQYSEEALQQFKNLDNLKGISDCLYYMGVLSFFNNDFQKSNSLLFESASIAENIGYKMRLADAKNNLGNICREQGKFQEAQPYYIESLTIARSIGDTVGVTFAYDNLGLILREQGQAAEGKRYIQEALILRQGFQDKWGIASCIHRLAGIAVAQDKPELAVVLWGVSERLWQELSSPKPKSYLKRFERDWNVAKDKLHDLVFQEAFAKGQAMSLDDAIELALRPDFGAEQKELV